MSTESVIARTKDLGQAAFYWCQPGVDLVELNMMEKPGKQVIVFTFKLPVSEEALCKLQLDYANNRTLVEPNTFISKQDKLRDLLFTAKGNLKRNLPGVSDGKNEKYQEEVSK